MSHDMPPHIRAPRERRGGLAAAVEGFRQVLVRVLCCGSGGKYGTVCASMSESNFLPVLNVLRDVLQVPQEPEEEARRESLSASSLSSSLRGGQASVSSSLALEDDIGHGMNALYEPGEGEEGSEEASLPTDPALSADMSSVSSALSTTASELNLSGEEPPGVQVDPEPPEPVLPVRDARYDSWAAAVAGVQALEEHGNVMASAAGRPRTGNYHGANWARQARPRMTWSASSAEGSGGGAGAGEGGGLIALPDEILDRILRYLSSRPRGEAPVWDGSVRDGSPLDAVNATSFALTCTRVYALFRERLVAVRTRPERYREDLVYSAPTAGVVVDVRAPADVVHLGSVLRLAGPALRELLITKSLPQTSWVDSYVACVTRLRKLSLRDVNEEYPLVPVLQASRRTLRELEIVGTTGRTLCQEQLDAMATCCSSVHTLALRLSMFKHEWSGVWMGMGPALRRLSLGATRFWIMDREEEELVGMIGRYCVDLQHLHFYHLGPALGAAVARLCARYGAQLETLELEQSQLLRVDVQAIAAACAGTTVSVSHGSSLFSHAYNVDVIDVLGGQISALRYRSQLAHDESLWEVSRKCTQLRELRLDCASMLTEAALESILKAVAPRLENLSLSFFMRGLERALASSAVRLLAEHAHELRKLHIGGQKFDIRPFQTLAHNCRATLSKVSITFGFRTTVERENVEPMLLVGVVNALHQCRLLRSLVIVDRTSSLPVGSTRELRQATYALRARAHCVSICGVDYVR